MAAEDLDLPSRLACLLAALRRVYAIVAFRMALEVMSFQQQLPLTRAQQECEVLNMVVRGQLVDSFDVPRESSPDRSLCPSICNVRGEMISGGAFSATLAVSQF